MPSAVRGAPGARAASSKCGRPYKAVACWRRPNGRRLAQPGRHDPALSAGTLRTRRSAIRKRRRARVSACASGPDSPGLDDSGSSDHAQVDARRRPRRPLGPERDGQYCRRRRIVASSHPPGAFGAFAQFAVAGRVRDGSCFRHGRGQNQRRDRRYRFLEASAPETSHVFGAVAVAHAARHKRGLWHSGFLQGVAQFGLAPSIRSQGGRRPKTL